MKRIMRKCLMGLSLIFLMLQATVLPLSASTYSEDISNISFTFTDLRSGKKETFQGKSGKPAIVVFGGVGSCYNTIDAISSMSQFSSSINAGNLRVYVIDIVNNTTSTITDCVKEQNLNEKVYVTNLGSMSSDALYTRVINVLKINGGFTMPLIAYIDANGKILEATMAYSSANTIKKKAQSIGIAADGSENLFTLRIKAKGMQSEARKQLEMINSFRTGNDAWYWNEDNTTKTEMKDLSALTYDYDLEKVALQRAFELAMHYGHDRPDGTMFWDAYDEMGYQWYTVSENIAAGFDDSQGVFGAWREDDEPYEGQGHRRNMLNPDVTAFAAAAVYFNGVCFWVEEFASPVNNAQKSDPLDTEAIREITMDKKYVQKWDITCAKDSLKMMESMDLSKEVSLLLTYDPNLWGIEQAEVINDITWKIESGSSFATLSGNKLTGKAEGEVTLKGTVPDKSEVTLTITITPPDNPFTDVNQEMGNTTFKAILWAYANGIVKGTSETTYSPDDPCTRAQLCVMLWRLMGKPAVNTTDNPFTDVTTELGNTTYKAILWAYQKGIVKGKGEGIFDPEGNTTRANMAVMLWRLAGKPAVSTESCPFEDVSAELGNTTYKSILWAYGVKLTKGTDETHFSPEVECTRAQLAVFLYRLNNLYGYKK